MADDSIPNKPAIPASSNQPQPDAANPGGAAAPDQGEALPPPVEVNVEARVGSRGDASGRNLEQARKIGEDDPLKGSVLGRRAFEGGGFPQGARNGTDAEQTEEAKRQQ